MLLTFKNFWPSPSSAAPVAVAVTSFVYILFLISEGWLW